MSGLPIGQQMTGQQPAQQPAQQTVAQAARAAHVAQMQRQTPVMPQQAAQQPPPQQPPPQQPQQPQGQQPQGPPFRSASGLPMVQPPNPNQAVKRMPLPSAAAQPAAKQARTSAPAPSGVVGGGAASDFQKEGNALYGKNDFAGAVERFTRALSVGSETPQLYSNRSAAHAAMGTGHAGKDDGAARANFEKALVDADHCIRLNSQWSKGYSRRGNALTGLQRCLAPLSPHHLRSGRPRTSLTAGTPRRRRATCRRSSATRTTPW
jgi:hypothetical protein